MSNETTLDFASVQAILTAESITAHGAELHGVLTGLVCAGFTFESDDYIAMINDLFNNGDGLPREVKSTVKSMFAKVWHDIIDDSYSFQLLLPDDDDSIVERGHALSVWVQGFNLGFGLQQKDKAVYSEDVKEVLIDFVEIANLSDEMEEDEDTEQAYFEIAEYVRISALLCFTELGSPPESKSEDETIH
jgi:yecA family protein